MNLPGLRALQTSAPAPAGDVHCTMISGKQIFIIMPAYRAAKKIKSVFGRIDGAALKAIDHFIIVVDGNVDDTLQKAQELQAEYRNVSIIFHENNLGYGRAQKAGYALALEMNADICALLHSDGQYAPELLMELLQPLAEDRADLVIGSRMLEKGRALKGGMPLYKYYANKILTGIENAVYGLKMSEYHSGYMLYNRRLLEKLPYTKLSDKFHFDGEMLMLAGKKGFRIKEISIPSHYSDEEKTLNPVAYGFEVLSIIAKYLLGKYES